MRLFVEAAMNSVLTSKHIPEFLHTPYHSPHVWRKPYDPMGSSMHSSNRRVMPMGT
jgi:hypothetical protein